MPRYTEAEAELVRAQDMAEVYQPTSTPAYLRDHASLAALLGDAALVETGLVDARHWRPTIFRNPSDRCGFYVAIAQP